jgi:hypothetical protein
MEAGNEPNFLTSRCWKRKDLNVSHPGEKINLYCAFRMFLQANSGIVTVKGKKSLVGKS